MNIRELKEQATITRGGMRVVDVERFAELVAAHERERLLTGMEMPEPVAHCGLSLGRKSIAYFDGRPIFMDGPIGNDSHPDPLFTLDQLRETVAAAVAHEREECAKMVDHILKAGGGTYGDAIRARGTR